MLSATWSWSFVNRESDFERYSIKNYEKSSFENGWKIEFKSDKDDRIFDSFLYGWLGTTSI
jgi:hypothetical protein